MSLQRRSVELKRSVSCPLITEDLRNTDHVVPLYSESLRQFPKQHDFDDELSSKRCDSYFSRIMTYDVKPISNVTFNQFNLSNPILKALDDKDWKWPSPIQEHAIPKIMTKTHLIARSKNGTGKTGAYAIALLNNIDIKHQIQMIVLVPTRELAFQTASVCISLAKYRDGLNVMVGIGGTKLSEDIYRVTNTKQPVQVLVGTPKRVLDLLRSKEIRNENVTSLVLDEVDKLLSLEFQEMIRNIMVLLPNHCQKLLFSATFPVSLHSFADKYLEGAVKCNLMNELTLKGVTQYYAYINENQKVACLRLLLKNLEVTQSIIFCNSTKRAELLAHKVTEMGFPCYYTHSQLDQQSRNKVFHDFRMGYVKNLVCTDIMTRGIDVPLINVVFNFDFPRFAESYLHRIGRCGRFGHLAIAINFITFEDKDCFVDIEKQLGKKILAIPKEIDKRLYVPLFQKMEAFEISFINV